MKKKKLTKEEMELRCPSCNVCCPNWNTCIDEDMKDTVRTWASGTIFLAVLWLLAIGVLLKIYGVI